MDYRSRLGLPLSQFAASIGVDRVWLWRVIEKGAQPSVDLAKRIEKATDGRIRWTEFFTEQAGAA